MTNAFRPTGNGVTSSSNSSAERLTLPAGNGYAFRFQVENTAGVYIKFGDSSVTASSSNFDAYLPPSIVEVLAAEPEDTHISILGGSTVRINRGVGI